jgi:hypothetical protein
MAGRNGLDTHFFGVLIMAGRLRRSTRPSRAPRRWPAPAAGARHSFSRRICRVALERAFRSNDSPA